MEKDGKEDEEEVQKRMEENVSGGREIEEDGRKEK